MSAPDPQKLSLNTATIREKWGLAQAIEGCARHGIRGISPWRDQLAAMGLKEAVRAMKAHGLAVTGLCRGGFFTAANWRDDNRRAIEEAHALGAQCLVLVVGGLPQDSKDLAGARQQVAEGIGAILPEARAAKVPLAIEPLHPMQAPDRACVNTLEQALDLCDALDPGGPGASDAGARAAHGGGAGGAPAALGVAVDVYHVWWDPKLEAQIARAGKRRLLAYHICDWLVPTRDTLNDRGMMGDGVIDLPRVRGLMERAGYDGAHEVEIFSKLDWWQRDPDEVLSVCKDRHARMT